MATRRLEFGFDGGTVLRLTVESAVADEVAGVLARQTGGWRAVESQEGTFWIDLGELNYVRLPPGEAPGRVGFGGS